LEGIAAYHAGLPEVARPHLVAAADLCRQLEVSDDDLSTLAAMGFRTNEVNICPSKTQCKNCRQISSLPRVSSFEHDAFCRQTSRPTGGDSTPTRYCWIYSNKSGQQWRVHCSCTRTIPSILLESQAIGKTDCMPCKVQSLPASMTPLCAIAGLYSWNVQF
jgi:hypothetical protein